MKALRICLKTVVYQFQRAHSYSTRSKTVWLLDKHKATTKKKKSKKCSIFKKKYEKCHVLFLSKITSSLQTVVS